MQVNKSMTIQNHQHIQITYITLTLKPAVNAYNVSARLCMAESMVFQSIRGCKQTGRTRALVMITDTAKALAGNLAVRGALCF